MGSNVAADHRPDDGTSELLTSGHLPVAAFEHLDPTAVGVIDLEIMISPTAPDGRRWGAGQRDGVVLVRLHGEPLKVMYLERAPSLFTADELAEAVWRSAYRELQAHVTEHQCVAGLCGPESLLEISANCEEACKGRWPTGENATVAVIVSTAHRDEQLSRAIRSILAQRRKNVEVIVVDNSPDSGKAWSAVAPIMAFNDRVRYVEEPRPGLSVARNRGVRETDADIVAFTDDDVIVDPAWLRWLLAPFEDSGVLVSCGMVLPLELETAAQKRFEQYAGFSKGMRGRVYDHDSGPAPGLLLYPFINGLIGTGNNMAFRRPELAMSGGFDPALGAGSPTGSCEETRAFGTAILRGGRIVYEPRALCWHEHRKDGDALATQIFGYGTGLGAVLARASLTDPRFHVSAIKSLRIAIGMRKRQRPVSEVPLAKPDELLRARRQGVIRGPWRYVVGVVRARKLGLRDVVRGR
jgi:GT2 family glycosyltransferase